MLKIFKFLFLYNNSGEKRKSNYEITTVTRQDTLLSIPVVHAAARQQLMHLAPSDRLVLLQLMQSLDIISQSSCSDNNCDNDGSKKSSWKLTIYWIEYTS